MTKTKGRGRKMSWNMFDNVENGEELDEATTPPHDNINAVMDKVTPWVTIKTKPD